MRGITKEIIKLIPSLVIAIAFVGVISFVDADWAAPVDEPPTCAAGNPGCSAPLHGGSAGQTKLGGLTIASGGGVTYGLLVPNGSVGIGTSNPTSKLHITGGSARADDFCLNNPSNTCLSNSGIVLYLQHAFHSPGDNQTAYWGFPATQPSISSPTYQKVFIPKSGTIKAGYLHIRIASALGSSETATVSVGVNNSNFTTFANNVTYTSASQTFSNTNLNISVNAGDFIEMRTNYPTFVTNPTNVMHMLVLYIE